MTDSGKERREVKRIKAAFRVRYKSLDQFITAYSKNISKGGIFIKTKQFLPLNTIVSVKREEYLVLASSMGADVVLSSKVLAGNKILKHVRGGKILSVAHLHGCEAEVMELVAEPSSPITRKPLYEQTDMKDRMLIGGVWRDDDWEIAVGSTQIEAGDKVIGICRSPHLPDLQRLFLA